jgi:hypothetical protein
LRPVLRVRADVVAEQPVVVPQIEPATGDDRKRGSRGSRSLGDREFSPLGEILRIGFKQPDQPLDVADVDAAVGVRRGGAVSDAFLPGGLAGLPVVTACDVAEYVQVIADQKGAVLKRIEKRPRGVDLARLEGIAMGDDPQ